MFSAGLGRWAVKPIDAVAAVLLSCGVALRAVRLSFPGQMMFDELHFVENARNYLAGKPDWNDHPPLGKLILAASIRLFGDQSLAWRLPLLVAGLLTIALAGVAVARLFKDVRTGVLAAALIAADGFFISYSRAGLLDGFLVACAAAALLIVTLRWTLLTAVALGLVCGVACSIKFSGVSLVATSMVALLLLRDVSWRMRVGSAALISVVTVLVYFVVFGLGLSLTGKSGAPPSVVTETLGLLKHHAAATSMTHPFTSAWPTWFLPTRPIIMGVFREGGGLRTLTTLGNLAVWWPAMVLAASLTGLVAWRGVGATLQAREGASWGPGAFLDAHGREVLLLGAGALLFVAPWMLSRRDSYIYHFLPAYLFFTVLLGAYVGWVARTRRSAALVFVAVVLVVLAFYAPAWSFGLITDAGFDARFVLPGWR
ncbi:MAG: hypothetical protein DI536_24365 [Archangium gephyra]|uniref:Polyprenol-phosphate-mannose--protein mannosyltransferase n=1 Tax=Archangium gephyra TaxID=48 RepID=A0A2W5VEQ6_9BACT|nr:MAG: hypothetical protein DI536_24365 [Archangium gephyra]